MSQENYASLVEQAEQQLYWVLGPAAKKFSEDVDGHIDYVDDVYDPENRQVSDAEMMQSIEDVRRALAESKEILVDLSETELASEAYPVPREEGQIQKQNGANLRGLLRDYRDVYEAVEDSALELEDSGMVSARSVLDELEEIF